MRQCDINPPVLSCLINPHASPTGCSPSLHDTEQHQKTVLMCVFLLCKVLDRANVQVTGKPQGSSCPTNIKKDSLTLRKWHQYVWKMNVTHNLLTTVRWLLGILATKEPSASLLKSIGELISGRWLSSSGPCQQVTPLNGNIWNYRHSFKNFKAKFLLCVYHAFPSLFLLKGIFCKHFLPILITQI